MKSNELMIGDWVCYDGDTDYDCPVKVDGICIDDISVDDEGFLGGLEGSVIPIPLTEEILKANGFRDDGCEFICKDNEVLIKIHKELKYISIINGEDYNYTTTKCKYIHELQHALRVCGLNYLADDFKLE